ncbi:MAG: hypothetical protein R3336_00080, partial [Phycisphaeraceae bacterium]|nr:hypothetical protein [Phycisphaeraceae bacterium]
SRRRPERSTEDGPVIDHVEADFTDPSAMDRLKPERFDLVLAMGSDRLHSGAHRDARTLRGYLALRRRFHDPAHAPRIMIELRDPNNAELIDDPMAEVLISPLLLSHVLSQVTLRPELRTVYEQLFTTGGAGIALGTLSGPTDTTHPGVLIGWRTADGHVHLEPDPQMAPSGHAVPIVIRAGGSE